MDLTDYLISDDQDYALLPGAFGDSTGPSIHASDFIAKFPVGASIPPGGVLVVALDGAQFELTYGFEADYEIEGTDPETPDLASLFGGTSSTTLTDSGETIVLFYWDGQSDLVQDVDMLNVGAPTASNAVGDKTGVMVDGPDPGSEESTYLNDAFTMPLQPAAPGSGKSTKRLMLEGDDETAEGGNGLTGNDETSENILLTWDSFFIEPDPGYCCLTLACYYASVDISTPETLRQTLHDVIDAHHRISYDAAWEVLEMADETPGNTTTVLDVYKNQTYPKVTGRCGVPFVPPCVQREHTWPNSYGFPDASAIPHSDCHALFLADGSYNMSRQSNPYDACDHMVCDERETVLNNGQGGGDSNWRTGQGALDGKWETWSGRRGDIARAQFYMDVRYEGDVEGEPDLRLTDNRMLIDQSTEQTAYMGLRSVLLSWHEEDPVDPEPPVQDQERWRNEVVYSYQRNRNPFIDHPEWVRCLYVEPCGIFADGFESGDVSAWSGTTP